MNFESRADAELVDELHARDMLDALTARIPLPEGHRWQVRPHPELPGWFWAAPVDASGYRPPGGVLLVGPNGRFLDMPSIPALNGSSKEAVAVIRELADSDLSDDELKSAIASREATSNSKPLA